MLATYNDREISGPIKILRMPAPIFRTPLAPQSLIHMCQGHVEACAEPSTMPSTLKEPTLIPLPSKELLRLQRRQAKYQDLTETEQRQLKRKQQAAQKKLQTVNTPEEAKQW